MKVFLFSSMLIVLACATADRVQPIRDTAAITSSSMDKLLGWVYGPEFDAC